MTIPPGRGVSGAGFELRTPTELININRQMLAELKLLRAGTRTTGTGAENANRGGEETSILGQVDTDVVGGLSNRRFVIPNLKEIYILDWPFELTSLEVRLNDPQSPAIEILRFGRRIKTRFPIKEIYITTPTQLSGQVVISSGDMSISDVPWSLRNPLSFEQRRKHVRAQDQGDDFDPLISVPIPLNQPGLFHAVGSRSATGITVFIDGITAEHRCRVYGWIQSELAGTGALIPRARVTWSRSTGGVRNVIGDGLFTVADSRRVHFDKEYLIDRVETEVNFELLTVGPVGNIIHAAIWLEVHPL